MKFAYKRYTCCACLVQADAQPEHARIQRRSLLASVGGAIAVLAASGPAAAWADSTASTQPQPVADIAASTSASDIKSVLVKQATIAGRKLLRFVHVYCLPQYASGPVDFAVKSKESSKHWLCFTLRQAVGHVVPWHGHHWSSAASQHDADHGVPRCKTRTCTAQVLVVGATGATGSRVVKQLSERGLDVRAGTRDVGKAEASGVRGAVKADVLDPRQNTSCVILSISSTIIYVAIIVLDILSILCRSCAAR